MFFKRINERSKRTALTIFSFLVWFKFRLSQLCSSFKIARLISRGHHQVSTLHCAWNFIFQGNFSLALLGSQNMDALFLDFKYFTAKIITQTQIDIHSKCLERLIFCKKKSLINEKLRTSEAQWKYGAEIATKNFPNCLKHNSFGQSDQLVKTSAIFWKKALPGFRRPVAWIIFSILGLGLIWGCVVLDRIASV